MHIIHNNCPGCSKCTRGICPVDAIKFKDNKVSIGQECIDCGLCIPVCPIQVISKKGANLAKEVQLEQVTTNETVENESKEVQGNERQETSTGV